MSKSRLIENALSLGTVQLVSLGLPLLSLPYLAARLGPGPLGEMAFAIAVAQIFLILSDYGFNLSASREVSINRDDKARVGEIWLSVTILRIIFSSVGLLVILVLSVMFSRFSADLNLVLLAYFVVIGNVIFPQWLFQGLETMRAVSIIQVLTRFLTFGSIFLLVKSPEDVHWAVLTQSSGTVLAGLIAIPWTRKALAGSMPSRLDRMRLTAQLQRGWHVFVSSALTSMYTQANTIVLGLLAAPSVVGHYYVAERLVRATQLVYGPVSSTIYPHLSKLAIEDPERALRFVGKVLRFATAIGLVFSAVIYFLAPLVVPIVFGPDNTAVASILGLFCLLPLVLVISNTLSIQTMLPFGMQSKLSRIYLFSAILNFFVFVPLTYYFGAHGAAIANVIVEIFVVLLMLFALQRDRIDILGVALNRRSVAVPKHVCL